MEDVRCVNDSPSSCSSRWSRLLSARRCAGRGPTGAEEARVRAVVGRYLHGLKFNDVKDLEAAFWPEAKLLFIAKDGSDRPAHAGAVVQTFAGSAGKEEEGVLRIAAADVTDDAASVKVVETYPKSIYVDYLSLLRVGGEWRIVNKIYTSRPR
jgi:hypothetical protein